MSWRDGLQLCLTELRWEKILCPLSNIPAAALPQQRYSVLLHFLPVDKFTSQAICPDLIKSLVTLQVKEDHQGRSH